MVTYSSIFKETQGQKHLGVLHNVKALLNNNLHEIHICFIWSAVLENSDLLTFIPRYAINVASDYHSHNISDIYGKWNFYHNNEE